MSLHKSQYDGLKMGINIEDDISDRILPYVKKATEAYHKSKDITNKPLTDSAIKFMKSITTKQP